MRKLIASSIIGLSAFTGASTATAAPTPVADDIMCFVHAIEPEKTDHNSVAPINFGFKVHCTDTPDLRSVTTKLWRYDPADGKQYVQSERHDTSTDPDVDTLYSASCSSAGVFYQFHTQVIVAAFHGNWYRWPDDSGTISAVC